MSDNLYNGRRFRVLNVLDSYNKDYLGFEVDTSINGKRVCSVLERIVWLKGMPEMITVDNGHEFIGQALDGWANLHGVKLVFNRPGKPVDNAYIESFNGRLRDGMPEHELVYESGSREKGYYTVARGLQYEPTAQFIRAVNTRRIFSSKNGLFPIAGGTVDGGRPQPRAKNLEQFSRTLRRINSRQQILHRLIEYRQKIAVGQQYHSRFINKHISTLRHTQKTEGIVGFCYAFFGVAQQSEGELIALGKAFV